METLKCHGDFFLTFSHFFKVDCVYCINIFYYTIKPPPPPQGVQGQPPQGQPPQYMPPTAQPQGGYGKTTCI